MTKSAKPIVFSRELLAILFLAILVLISALAVVYLKDYNRRQFINLQKLQHTRDNLRTEWGKLLLEESTWATQARVQRMAQEQMNMQVIRPKRIIMVNK